MSCILSFEIRFVLNNLFSEVDIATNIENIPFDEGKV